MHSGLPGMYTDLTKIRMDIGDTSAYLSGERQCPTEARKQLMFP